jgi:cell division protein WhiA
VASPAVARRAFSLFRSYGVSCEIRTFRRQAFDRASRFQLHLEDNARALQALNEAGILDAKLAPLDRPPRRLVARPCCRSAYLRGVFLGAGSVTGPRSGHFELRAADADAARFLAELARTDGFPLASYERGGHSVAYAKSIEAIAELLAFLGAQDAALRLGEAAVVGATRARANRLANADHANLVRASRAAERQLRAVRRLEASGRLRELAPDLQEIARLRARHPTLSLRELARRCRPPATKAAAQRRLARLERLAER